MEKEIEKRVDSLSTSKQTYLGYVLLNMAHEVAHWCVAYAHGASVENTTEFAIITPRPTADEEDDFAGKRIISGVCRWSFKDPEEVPVGAIIDIMLAGPASDYYVYKNIFGEDQAKDLIQNHPELNAYWAKPTDDIGLNNINGGDFYQVDKILGIDNIDLFRSLDNLISMYLEDENGIYHKVIKKIRDYIIDTELEDFKESGLIYINIADLAEIE